LGMYLLAFLGWRWGYAWRKESMPASLAVLWLPLPYVLGHAGLLHGPRLPLDGVLLTFAAFALVCLVPGVGGRLREGKAPPVAAADEQPEAQPDAVALGDSGHHDATALGTAMPHQGPQQKPPGGRSW